RNVTEFNYRYNDAGEAHLFVGVELTGGAEEQHTVAQLIRSGGYEAVDITDNEVAKLHVRHLVGGAAPGLNDEKLFRFEFPERPGALSDFLNAVGEQWNITLFHYRNHGSDFGRVLTGITVDDDAVDALKRHLDTLKFAYWDESNNPAYRLFLRRNR
ncbi:MAG: threonine ammonia-lyase, biosynthetic, partial [Pseudomonadota bacterium]